MRIAIFAAGAALLLAGCQQTPPARRPGLWFQSFAQDGSTRNLGPSRSLRVCIGAHTDAKNAIFNYDLAVKLAKERRCETPTAGRTLNGFYKFKSDCPLPNSTGRSLLLGTASGDFSSGYHLRMQTDTTYSPPFTALNGHHVIDIDGKWLGPCPAGMAPGDMVLANGEKAPGGVVMDPHHPPS